MRIGDVVLVGRNFGRVRAMHDEHGKALKSKDHLSRYLFWVSTALPQLVIHSM